MQELPRSAVTPKDARDAERERHELAAAGDLRLEPLDLEDVTTEPEVVEGELLPGYLSMVEFPSLKHAKAWYDSPEYAEARVITPTAFRGRLLMFVEGIETSD